jgi:ketosteroid isomerase-like protein
VHFIHSLKERIVREVSYEINVAKSSFREAYNACNVDRLLAVFADELTDMAAGAPSFFGADAKSVVRSRLTNLFERYHATLIVTVIAICVFDNTAFDYGWHTLTLTPRDGSKPITDRDTLRPGRRTPMENGRSISTLTTWTWLP